MMERGCLVAPTLPLYHDCCITWKWCILYARRHTPSVITYYRHGYSLSLSQVKHCNYIHTQPSLDPGQWRMVPSTQSSHPAPLIDVVLMIIIARADYCPENRCFRDTWHFLEANWSMCKSVFLSKKYLITVRHLITDWRSIFIPNFFQCTGVWCWCCILKLRH